MNVNSTRSSINLQLLDRRREGHEGGIIYREEKEFRNLIKNDRTAYWHRCHYLCGLAKNPVELLHLGQVGIEDKFGKTMSYQSM